MLASKRLHSDNDRFLQLSHGLVLSTSFTTACKDTYLLATCILRVKLVQTIISANMRFSKERKSILQILTGQTTSGMDFESWTKSTRSQIFPLYLLFYLIYIDFQLFFCATKSLDSRKCCYSGDSHCFLFSAKPTMGVYQPTGYNENYMYLNRGMQTLPNGLVSNVKSFDMCFSHRFQI